eukprot:7116665-Alexandrium_andersonii.AAC.1
MLGSFVGGLLCEGPRGPPKSPTLLGAESEPPRDGTAQCLTEAPNRRGGEGWYSSLPRRFFG